MIIQTLSGHRIHELKTLSPYFVALYSNVKNFEVRKDDRDFKIGDELILKEFIPDHGYTGRILHRMVNYKLDGGQFGIEKGYCILGIQKI